MANNMKFNIFFALLVLAVLIIPMGNATPVPPDEEEVRVYLIGPSVVGLGEVVFYDIIVTGGPAEDGGEWFYTSEVRGVNLTATELYPAEGNSTTSGFFFAGFKAPNEVQEVEIIVEGISQNHGIKDSAEIIKKVKIINPYRLTATVTNDGAVEVKDLTVRFYVDGELLDEKSIPSLGVDESKLVVANWTIENPDAGRHVARVELDTEDAGVVLLESGSKIYLREFYIQEDESSVPWALSILVLIGAVAGSVYLLRKSGYI